MSERPCFVAVASSAEGPQCSDALCPLSHRCLSFVRPDHAPAWVTAAEEVKPVRCSDCTKQSECPTPALRHRGYGCSAYEEKDWTHQVEEILKTPETEVLEKLGSIFNDKDQRIKELQEKLEEAEAEVRRLRSRLASVAAAVLEEEE